MSSLPKTLPNVAASVKRAFSREAMLAPLDDDESRLKRLGSALGVDTLAADSGAVAARPGERASVEHRAGAAAAAAAERLTEDDDFDADEEDDAARVSSVPRSSSLARAPLKRQVWALMSDPGSSRAAQLIAIAVMLLIVLSCVAYVVQTMPEYSQGAVPAGTAAAFRGVDIFCLLGFTAELGARVWSCPDRVRFLTTPMTWVDILTVAPYYVELVIGSAGAASSPLLRMLRLFRVFSVFKVSRYLPWVRVVTNAVALSTEPLVMLLCVVLLAMVLFSSAMYFAERGEWREAEGAWLRWNEAAGAAEKSPFPSIPAAFWWCIVTMTTVGYGDVVPVTVPGRLIAACTALSGILVIAIPVSIISTNFNSEFLKLQRQRETIKARMLLLKKHFR
jgi:potassium voltage-gated channel Shaker-related subfamily A protein